ncbi:hypothetical protein [uncultured Chryseobacterium sp.]|uniref:hypothetical protein n=1 Tax=uncultured Chryseobacterium sp. TaxID=259322 RepID=UPI0026340E09|nr:hypothetical protein [uncultured Chryseobacterium sp.]
MEERQYGKTILKRYSYEYDRLNRLNTAVYITPGTTLPFNQYYNESVEYDLNGNITHLSRNAPSVSSTSYETIDDLSYEYIGNQLSVIYDDSGNPSGYEGDGNHIEYDGNGNMLQMKDKMIEEITYNHLNLPNQFTINGQHKNMSYLYR